MDAASEAASSAIPAVPLAAKPGLLMAATAFRDGLGAMVLAKLVPLPPRPNAARDDADVCRECPRAGLGPATPLVLAVAAPSTGLWPTLCCRTCAGRLGIAAPAAAALSGAAVVVLSRRGVTVSGSANWRLCGAGGGGSMHWGRYAWLGQLRAHHDCEGKCLPRVQHLVDVQRHVGAEDKPLRWTVTAGGEQGLDRFGARHLQECHKVVPGSR